MIGPSTDRIGQRFGPYEITRFLGRGGFADVFLGKNVNLPAQEVAIKVLDKIMIRYDKTEQFKKEAAIILTLRHPSIVHFYTYDVYHNPNMTDTIYPYIVMEYASHGSLRSHHPRGVSLPFETIVTYIQQIASALQYAHGNQVMHLDVKPENILVNKQGKLLLSDFGLATVITEQRRSTDIQGTLSYMAPEQFEGRPDKASDQYSLAVMVYEWLCGSVPFIGRSLQEHIDKLLHEPPPSLTARVPRLDPAVESVVMRALAKNARERYGSVLQFAEQLEKAIKDPRQISAAPNSPAIVTPVAPMPQAKSASALKPPAMPALPPGPVQAPQPQPAANAGGLNQPSAAIAPQIPPLMPVLQPPVKQAAPIQELPAAAPGPAFAVPALPAANPPVNQPLVPPDAQNAGGAALADPAVPQGTPFFVKPPPRVQEANEPDPHSSLWVVGAAQPAPAVNAPDPQQTPWVVAPGGMGGQGGVPSVQTKSPFLDGRPQKAEATPGQQTYAGGAGPANPARPFLGYSSPAYQQQNDPGQIRFGPVPESPEHAYSQTIRAFNVMDEPAPPALPPYLGRPGNGGTLNQREEKSVQDFLGQTMQELLQPRRGRRRASASPLFAVFIAASVIGAIYFAVWLGRVSPSTGNETAWMGLILTIIFSLFTFWLFDYTGSGLIKVVAASFLAIDWGLFGYAFAAVIGAGTHIGILPDSSIMAVLFLFGTLGLCAWKMYKGR